MVRDGLRPPHHKVYPYPEEPQSGVSKDAGLSLPWNCLWTDIINRYG